MNPNNITRNRISVIASVVAFIFALTMVFMEERRAIELEKSASTMARLLVTIKDSNTGIVEVMISESTVSYSNEAAREIFGYSATEFKGLPLVNLVPDAMVDAHSLGFLNSEKKSVDGTLERRVISIQCSAKRKDGTEIPVFMRIYIGKSSIIAMVNKGNDTIYLPSTRNESKSLKGK